MQMKLFPIIIINGHRLAKQLGHRIELLDKELRKNDKEHPYSVESHLYDLFDQTKFELSELNQSKSLVINGPDSQLIKRELRY